MSNIGLYLNWSIKSPLVNIYLVQVHFDLALLVNIRYDVCSISSRDKSYHCP